MDSKNHQAGDLADIFGPRSSAIAFDDPLEEPDHHTSFQNTGFGQVLPFDPLLHEFVTLGDDDPMINVTGGDHKNMFSNMVQISPNNKSTLIDQMVSCSSGGNITTTTATTTSTSCSKSCLLESSQISSPRNTGMKRRKSQAKKVVCIPAPTPASSRPTGEVVPSDLWAWRKYGQKPIKGSPFPRGYYRCSSSKGCSARKQVERSRTDPNMLVITYTSEHNHPWPTQRNALAGSTRSQLPSKTTTTTANEKNPLPEEPTKLPPTTSNEKELPPLSHTNGLPKKEELLFDGVEYQQSYKPQLPDQGQVDHDLFASLGEIPVDPLTLLLNQDFSGGDEEGDDYNKDLDPFNFYSWK